MRHISQAEVRPSNFQVGTSLSLLIAGVDTGRVTAGDSHLGKAGALETLHLAFSSSGWLM
jgi:hypothetical protein